jgi:hypothetical protein
MSNEALNNTALKYLGSHRRAVVAEFLDDNPEAFPPPVDSAGWLAYFQEGIPLNTHERKQFDRGLGMLVAVFRTAQVTMPECQPLSDMLSPEKLPEVLEVEIDPVAFALMGGDMDDEEAVAFARSVTLLKRMTGLGVVNPEQILALIEQTMDALPGNSKLQRSAHEFAKRLALANVEFMMAS